MSKKEAKEKQKLDLTKLSVTELLAKKAEKRAHIGEITQCIIHLEPTKTDDLYVLTCGHTFSSAAMDMAAKTSATCPDCRKPYSGPMTATELTRVMEGGVEVVKPIVKIVEVKPVQNFMLKNVLNEVEAIEAIDTELEKRMKKQPDSQNQIQIKELTDKIKVLEGRIKTQEAQIEKLKKTLISQAENLNSEKEKLQDSCKALEVSAEELSSTKKQLKDLQEATERELKKARQDKGLLEREIEGLKAQIKNLSKKQPVTESIDAKQLPQSQAPMRDEKHSQPQAMEHKKKGKNKGKQTATVSQPIVQSLAEEKSAQQVAAHDAKPLQPALPAGDVPALPREEAKAAGQGLNKWHARLGKLKTPAFFLMNLGIGAILSKLINFFPSNGVINQQGPATSIIPSVNTSNIMSLADLKPHLSALLTANPESALPDFAKLFGDVLTPEQRSQFGAALGEQQAVNTVSKQEDQATAEQPGSSSETEDTETLEQQFELAKDYLRRGGYESILQGRALQQALVKKGYSPAQYIVGENLDIMGHVINRVDLVEQGKVLLQLAVNQGNKGAGQWLTLSYTSVAIPSRADLDKAINSLIENAEWVNKDLTKRFRAALHKRHQRISEKMTLSEKDQVIKERGKAFESIKQLAEKENYAPAQYWYGFNLLEASKSVDDENFKALREHGSTLLEKAANQGVKEAEDVLMKYAFINPQNRTLSEAISVLNASRTTTDGDKPSANLFDKNEEETTATPSVPSVQAKGDNNSLAAAGKVSEAKNSSSESQEERFKTSEQYMGSGDVVLMPKGNDLLIALAEEGYPPAQLKRGIHMVFAGHHIAREDLVNKGMALMQAAADKKYQIAVDYLRNNDPRRAKIAIDTVVQDAAGQKWAGSKHLEKRFQAIVEKVYGVSLEGFTSPQNQQSKDEAFSELEKLARVENYAPAQYCLGYSFLVAGKSLNSPAFIGRGIMWLEKAAEQGAKNAIDLLATDSFTKDHFASSQQSSGTGDNDDFSRVVHAYKICEHGIQAFNKKKPKESFALFSQAAKLGNGLAQYFLAQQYETAYGVPRDLSLAAQLYEAAVKKGVRQAYVELGIFYKEGKGVKKDWSIARSLFQRALDSPATIELPGSVGGGSYLEKINQADNSYQSGLKLLASNTPSDDLLAAEQFRLAAIEGHEDAQRMLDDCFSSTAERVERTGTCRFSPTVPEQASAQVSEESKAATAKHDNFFSDYQEHLNPEKWAKIREQNQYLTMQALQEQGKFAFRSKRPASSAGGVGDKPAVARKGK